MLRETGALLLADCMVCMAITSVICLHRRARSMPSMTHVVNRGDKYMKRISWKEKLIGTDLPKALSTIQWQNVGAGDQQVGWDPLRINRLLELPEAVTTILTQGGI
jgi:hypothetical protein